MKDTSGESIDSILTDKEKRMTGLAHTLATNPGTHLAFLKMNYERLKHTMNEFDRARIKKAIKKAERRAKREA